MTEFNIRTDSVDVEQIMRQIRARIKEKRGVDYTEQQIQELANVKLERFLDPKGVRSDLVEQFKRTRGTSPEPQNYGFEDTMLYESHRGFIRFIRKLLNPILKLFFNPHAIVRQHRMREERDALYYEVIHNLVLEVTRLGIESKNLKMRLESLSSRMDFDERRARALEGAVQYKPGTGPAREPQPQALQNRTPEPQRQQPQRRPPREPRPQHQPPPQAEIQPPPAGQGADAGMSGPGVSEQPVDNAAAGTAAAGTPGARDASGAPGTARRRRRRRRGRRGGRGRGEGASALSATGPASGPGDAPGAQPGHSPQNEFYDSESDADPGSEADEDPEPSEQ